MVNYFSSEVALLLIPFLFTSNPPMSTMLSHFHLPGSAPASRPGTPGSVTPSKPPISADDNVPFELVRDEDRRKRIVVAITGATGSLIAIRLLQALRALDIETHLIMSKWALQTLRYETDMTADEVRSLLLLARRSSSAMANSLLIAGPLPRRLSLHLLRHGRLTFQRFLHPRWHDRRPLLDENPRGDSNWLLR